MKALVVLALATGCVSVGEEARPWEPADTITGELAPELGPAIAASRRPDRLRVVTWNVHFAADPDDLAAELARSALADADVIAIQEVEAYPDEPATRAHRLADALGMTWAYAPARAPGVDGTGTHGIALLSRFPLDNVEIRRLPYIDQPIHPRHRNALSADLVLGDRRVRFVVVHLDTRIDPADRIRQLDPAVTDLPEPAVDRVIVAGDFNTNPWTWVDDTVPLTGTEAIVGMEQAVVVDDYFDGLGFASAVSTDAATLRVPALAIRADDIYTSGLSITAAGVEHVDGSDHWPVWADVTP